MVILIMFQNAELCSMLRSRWSLLFLVAPLYSLQSSTSPSQELARLVNLSHESLQEDPSISSVPPSFFLFNHFAFLVALGGINMLIRFSCL